MKGAFKILASYYHYTRSWKQHPGFSLSSGAHETSCVLSNTGYWQFRSGKDVAFLSDILVWRFKCHGDSLLHLCGRLIDKMLPQSASWGINQKTQFLPKPV